MTYLLALVILWVNDSLFINSIKHVKNNLSFKDTDSVLDDIISKSGSRAASPSITGVSSRKLNYPSSKRQEPFQPGSSPVHLLHRYMVKKFTISS